MSLEFEDMEKLRQFFDQQEQNETERNRTNKKTLAERKQELAERKQEFAERKQRQKEQQETQAREQQEPQKNKSAFIICLFAFLSVIVEVIACLCILLKY